MFLHMSYKVMYIYIYSYELIRFLINSSDCIWIPVRTFQVAAGKAEREAKQGVSVLDLGVLCVLGPVQLEWKSIQLTTIRDGSDGALMKVVEATLILRQLLNAS